MQFNEPSSDPAELFLLARSLSDRAREDFLGRLPEPARTEVLSLLRHDATPHPLLAGFGEPVDWSQAWSPDQIGGHKIVRRIGEGSTGVVFEAIDEPLGRRLAIKTLLPGRLSSGALRRFDREARVLASLNHPGIARIIGVGAIREGRFTFPYLVMEYADGVRLDSSLAAMPLPQRLETLARVCDAVQHAHHKGIIHRDLKPSNILVDQAGTPRVLDFGIARLLSDDDSERSTLTGEILGTPPYLAPEQASGDRGSVDSRCDVYAVGVMLREIVQEPGRSLGGDLAAVIAKATAARPDDRYTNASDLAADLRHLIRREPVSARNYDVLSSLVSFARRHKALVAGLFVLAASTGAALWQAHRASAGFAALRDINLLLGPAPTNTKIDQERSAALVKSVHELDLGGPIERAGIYTALGNFLMQCGPAQAQDAAELLSEAYKLRKSHLPADDPRVELAKALYANALLRAGKIVDAERVSSELLREATYPSVTNSVYGTTLLIFCESLRNQGRYQEAIEHLTPLAAEGSVRRLPGMYILGECHMRVGNYAAAKQLFEEVNRHLSGYSIESGLYFQNQCMMANLSLLTDGDCAASERLLREVTQCETEVSDMDWLLALAVAAGNHWAMGEFDKAEVVLNSPKLLRLASDMSLASGAALEAQNIRGVLRRDQGRWDEAESILRSVLARRTLSYGESNPSTTNSMVNLAMLLIRRNDATEQNIAEARRLIDSALVKRRFIHGDGVAETLEVEALLGECMVAAGEQEVGLRKIRDVLDSRSEKLEGNWIADLVDDCYARALMRSGRKADALRFLTSEYDRAMSMLGPTHLVTIRRSNRLQALSIAHK